MRTAHIAAAAIAAFAFTAGTVGIASAATAPAAGPNTAACLTAQGVVKADSRRAVKAALQLGRDTDGMSAADQAAITSQLAVVSAAKAKLDTALAALTANASDANAQSAQSAGEVYSTAIANLLAIPAAKTLGADTDAVVKAQSGLTSALARENAACTAPVVIDPTAAPLPTTTVAPPPTTSNTSGTSTTSGTTSTSNTSGTSSTSGSSTVANTVPTGAVNTGWAA